ncbi:RNA polymerase sigma factor [Candidatus Sumerlaeota bacterium]|nr:RNA polymerase sigma factor [Candidatus Sumerlaeota bacterium]
MHLDEEARTDLKLIRAAQDGDVLAFEAIVERYFSMIYAITYSRLGNREAAEDLTQEVFLRVYLHFDQLQNPERFVPWLCRIARNLAINRGKQNYRHSKLLSLAPETTENIPDETEINAQETMTQNEENRIVHQAIMQLPPNLREVVLLHFMEGLNKAQIATRMDSHPSTVGRQLDKALLSLRQLLTPVLHESMKALRPNRRIVRRTVVQIGLVSALSANAKDALALADGGADAIAAAGAVGGSIGKTTGVSGIGSALLWMMKRTSIQYFSNKTAAVIVTTIGMIAGGFYFVSEYQSGGPPHYRREIREVRRAFLAYQAHVRAGNAIAAADAWDTESLARLSGRDERWLHTNLGGHAIVDESRQMIGNLTIDSISVFRTEAVELIPLSLDSSMKEVSEPVRIEPPIMEVKAGVWNGYFHKNGNEWKLINDESPLKEEMESFGRWQVTPIEEDNEMN